MKGKRIFDSFSFVVVKISEDPAGFIDGPNLYAYARMNPIMFLDPWGLCGENGDSPFIPFYIVPNTISNIDPNLLTTATIPREPSTYDSMSWWLGMLVAGGSGFRGPELNPWKDRVTGEIVRKWHFHLGSNKSGLGKHHLPYEMGRWLKNFISVLKR